MFYKQQRELHSQGKISIPRTSFVNDLPSDTDPTQDVPIKNINIGINGEPLNVRRMPMSNGVPLDKMMAIDRRNNDKFDVLGELQASQKNVSTIINKQKQIDYEKKID